MRPAPLLAAVLLGSLLVAGAPTGTGEDPVEVSVRIEGANETIWSGSVALSGTYNLTETTSGKAYELEARTPLGALHAAADEAGVPIRVDDDFAPGAFFVEMIDGTSEGDVLWWDYRVDLVATYYTGQTQWLDYGPGLEDGDTVLWYLESTGSRPLRLDAAAVPPTDLAPSVDGSGPDGAAMFRVEWPLVDPHHRPGQPWPTQVWVPAHGASITGDVSATAPAGVSVVPLDAGSYVVEAKVDADRYPVPTVPSAQVEVQIP